VIDLSGGVAGDNTLPDVGGDWYPNEPSLYCVVWQHAVTPTEVDVMFRRTYSNGALRRLGSESLGHIELARSKPLDLADQWRWFMPPYESWNVVFDREVSPGNRDDPRRTDMAEWRPSP
jgi:hypothetical protein